MVFRLPSVILTHKQLRKLNSKNQSTVPKGHVAVYVGDNNEAMKRYVVPLSYLSHPAFQDLLARAEEEFGFNHPMGGLTIPCDEKTFIHVVNDQLYPS